MSQPSPFDGLQAIEMNLGLEPEPPAPRPVLAEMKAEEYVPRNVEARPVAAKEQKPSGMGKRPWWRAEVKHPRLVLGVGLATLIAGAAWLFQDPIGVAMDEVLALAFGPELVKAPPPKPRPVPAKAPQEPVLEIGGVYGAIPNPFPTPMPMDRPIKASEGQAWRKALDDKYMWPRYKAILAIRSARLEQSSPLLLGALGDHKFWVRMAALMTLADFGVRLSKADLLKVLGDAKDYEVAHYLMRYKQASLGELYVLRALLGVVSPPVRLAILRILAEHGLGQYVEAATKDRDLVVRAWALHRLGAGR